MLDRVRFCDLSMDFYLSVHCGHCRLLVMVWATPSQQTVLSALEAGRLRCRRCGNPAESVSLERTGVNRQVVEKWCWPTPPTDLHSLTHREEPPTSSM